MENFELPAAPTIKQHKPVDKRAYTIVPIRAATDRRINPAAMRVLLVVCSYANKAGLAWPSHANVGKDLGVSRQGAGRQIRILRELGYLKVVKNHSHGKTAQILRVIYNEDLSNRELMNTIDFDNLPPTLQAWTEKKSLELLNQDKEPINNVALTAKQDRGLELSECCGYWLKSCSAIGISRQITEEDKRSLSVLASSGVVFDVFKQAVDDVLVDWQTYRKEPPHRLSYFLRLSQS